MEIDVLFIQSGRKVFPRLTPVVVVTILLGCSLPFANMPETFQHFGCFFAALENESK